MIVQATMLSLLGLVLVCHAIAGDDDLLKSQCPKLSTKQKKKKLKMCVHEDIRAKNKTAMMNPNRYLKEQISCHSGVT